MAEECCDRYYRRGCAKLCLLKWKEAKQDLAKAPSAVCSEQRISRFAHGFSDVFSLSDLEDNERDREPRMGIVLPPILEPSERYGMLVNSRTLERRHADSMLSSVCEIFFLMHVWKIARAFPADFRKFWSVNCFGKFFRNLFCKFFP